MKSTNICKHTVVPPDDGPRYPRNLYMLTKYTENKLCIKLVFLYTFFCYSLQVREMKLADAQI